MPSYATTWEADVVGIRPALAHDGPDPVPHASGGILNMYGLADARWERRVGVLGKDAGGRGTGGGQAVAGLCPLPPLPQEGFGVGRDAGLEVVAKQDLGRGAARGGRAITDPQEATAELHAVSVAVGPQEKALGNPYCVLSVAAVSGLVYGAGDAPAG